jgi:type III secretion system low calcium response chaperone LcrH/SycD
MAQPLHKEIQEAFKKLGDKVPENMRRSVEKAVTNIYEGNLSPMKAVGMSPNQAELLYHEAYQLFQSGKYKEALSIFYFLRELEVDSFRYNFAIAACYQYLKDYQNAIANYLMCTYINFKDPMPYYHMYDCYLKQSQLIPALQSIVSVLIAIKKRPEYAKLKEKAVIEYRSLKKLIKTSSLENNNQEKKIN